MTLGVKLRLKQLSKERRVKISFIFCFVSKTLCNLEKCFQTKILNCSGLNLIFSCFKCKEWYKTTEMTYGSASKKFCLKKWCSHERNRLKIMLTNSWKGSAVQARKYLKNYNTKKLLIFFQNSAEFINSLELFQGFP